MAINDISACFVTEIIFDRCASDRLIRQLCFVSMPERLSSFSSSSIFRNVRRIYVETISTVLRANFSELRIDVVCVAGTFSLQEEHR